MPSFPALQQAGVRYRWDGEETYGMLERSNPLDKISLGSRRMQRRIPHAPVDRFTSHQL